MRVLTLTLFGLVLFASSAWQAYRFWKEERASAIAVLMIGWGAGTLLFVFPVLVPIVWPDAQDSLVFRALAIITVFALATGGVWIIALFWKKLRDVRLRE